MNSQQLKKSLSSFTHLIYLTTIESKVFGLSAVCYCKPEPGDTRDTQSKGRHPFLVQIESFVMARDIRNRNGNGSGGGTSNNNGQTLFQRYFAGNPASDGYQPVDHHSSVHGLPTLSPKDINATAAAGVSSTAVLKKYLCCFQRSCSGIFFCLIFASAVFTTLMLWSRGPNTTQFAKSIAESYMSCYAPLLGNFPKVLWEVDKDPCSQRVLGYSIDMEEINYRIARDRKLPPDARIPDVDCTHPANAQLDECRLEWITFSTKCSNNLNRLADVTDMVGMKLTVLGLHTRWRGFGGRIRVLREYLRTLPQVRLFTDICYGDVAFPGDFNEKRTNIILTYYNPPFTQHQTAQNKIVIFSDSDDVAFLPTCSVSRIANTFRSHHTPILFMSERACWPDYDAWPRYPSPPRESPFLYLNGGTYLGYPWALIDAINIAYTGDCTDDQRGFTRVYLEQTGYVGVPNGERQIVSSANDTDTDNVPADYQRFIKLDWFNSLTQSLYDSRLEELDFSKYESNGTIVNLLTGGTPCIFHQNGDKGKSPILPRLISRMGIDDLRQRLGYLDAET
ncbi:hypothetical protein HK102_002781 [Quaeritorhiza haematococci]|nr:hypothetical protein HK102_002781 [Quaeritorhiza haematococci]